MYLYGDCQLYSFIENINSLKINSKYLLLKCDDYNFYFPKIWFYKFELLKEFIKQSEEKNLNASENELFEIDMGIPFQKYVSFETLNFKLFPIIFYHLCINNLSSHDKKYLSPCIDFFQYLGLEDIILSSLLSK